MSDEDALFVFHLAPLSVRRDIAMLGVVHRTVLGWGPVQFRDTVSFSKLRHSTATLPGPAPNVPDTVFN